MSGMFGFWMFMTVFIIIQAFLYNKGHDTLLFVHKTEVELQLQLQALKGK